MSVKLLTVDNVAEWQAILPAHISVFGSVEYARIYQQHTGHVARLFVVESDGPLVVYPFFLRPIHKLPFAPAAQMWDTLTPEFTGPIQLGLEDRSAAECFCERHMAMCREQNIVAEFAHLHPWHWRADLLDPACVALDREIVYVDLTWPEERLWRDSFTYACRKNIKRTVQENVRAFVATTPDHVREFYRIYVQTMNRRQALEKYYFSLDYFMAFFEQMPNSARFVLAEYQGQIVAATLYLHDDTDVYSYLGGADHTFQNARPSNAIVYDTIRWAQGQSKKRLILGGGYTPDDGIFRFKASFSPLRARFHLYKRVHRPDEYAALCNAWSVYYGGQSANDYFPAYRSIPVVGSDQ